MHILIISTGWKERIGEFLCRVFFLLIVVGFGAVVLPATVSENLNPAASFPSSFPRELLEIYLRFHDERLCRGVESVFVSNESGMEVWCRVEDEGHYKKLLKMLQPLSDDNRVRMHTTWFSEGEDSDEADALPPSLWENDELRSLFLDPLVRLRNDEYSSVSIFLLSPETIFKQRLLLFLKQTLDVSKYLERYADDLPTLTYLALDPDLDPELSSLAIEVCRKHSREVEKQIGKLEKNLKIVLPGKSGKAEPDPQELSPVPIEALPDLAKMISESTRSMSRRVYSYIYPERYTVQLDELRNPELLNSLRILRELNNEFLRIMEQTFAGK